MILDGQVVPSTACANECKRRNKIDPHAYFDVWMPHSVLGVPSAFSMFWKRPALSIPYWTHGDRSVHKKPKLKAASRVRTLVAYGTAPNKTMIQGLGVKSNDFKCNTTAYNTTHYHTTTT